MKPTWSRDGIDLYLGDCLEVLPHVKADCVVTDPPYGTQDLGNGYGRSHETIANDVGLDVVAAVAVLAHEALPQDSCAIAFCSARKRRQAEDAWLAGGFTLLGEAVWDKCAPGLGWRIRYAHETALVFEKGTMPKPETALLSMLRYSRPSAKARTHPTEKPVALIERLVAFAARKGQAVLDPCMGSGTTIEAAIRLGRKAIGVELDPHYFWDICVPRIEKALAEKRSELPLKEAV